MAAPHRDEPVDVVIVGAGLSGAAFAWRLSRKAPKLRILCLERGGWIDRRRMPAWDARWQSSALGGWASSPNLRLGASAPGPSADYAIDDSGSALKPLMWNGVGGSTINWAAHFPRLHPSDFRTFSLDGVGEDWPFGYDALEP
jgi:choline dehydrogenase-like flavoprotein